MTRDAWAEAERASEARHGGRIIRQTLADGYSPLMAATRALARTFAKHGAMPDLWRPRDIGYP